MVVKVLKLRWRNLMFVLLTLLGISLLALGWSGLPEKLTGNGEIKLDSQSTPAIESGERQISPAAQSGSDPVTANVIKMPGDPASAGEYASNYYVDCRLERQRTRAKRLEALKEIIDNPASSAEIRTEAQQSVMAINQNISREVELENLIRAKGFKDVIVYLKDDSANVVVKSDGLTAEEAARISDLVARGTGIVQQNVVIIPND